MQCHWIDPQSPASLTDSPGVTAAEAALPIPFRARFEGEMGMYADCRTVADYLDAHQGWFPRCAQPMEAEPLGDDSYLLTIGRFGALGYEVEPKLAVALQSSREGTYLMESIPASADGCSSYEVDYRAVLELLEIPAESAGDTLEAACQGQFSSPLPPAITQIKWELDLKVTVQFPNFIYKLPASLVQRTGNRVLTEIVRQVSPRLTRKVQRDFHSRFNLPAPPKNSHSLRKLN